MPSGHFDVLGPGSPIQLLVSFHASAPHSLGMLSNDPQGRIRVMQEGFQVLRSITKAMLALCLAVAWFVGTALAVYYVAGDGNFLWLHIAYALPAGLYFHFQGPRIKRPSLYLLWFFVIVLGSVPAGLELLFAAFLLLNALGLG